MEDPFDDSRNIPRPQLTPEDRSALASLVQSPAWSILREKVWMHLRRMAVTNLVEGKPGDISHIQGYYEGLRMAEASAIVCSQPDKPKFEPIEPLESKLTPKSPIGGML
jgi:hypothetical protein